MRYGVDDVKMGGVHEPKAKARFLLVWPATEGGGTTVLHYIPATLATRLGLLGLGNLVWWGPLQSNCQVAGAFALIT